MNKEYIGDGVYINNDGYSIILTTENGISTQNEIYLESAILRSMLDYIRRFEELGVEKS